MKIISYSMKSILETIKESQVNECGFSYYELYGGCGGRGGGYTSVNKNVKSPREKDEEKKALKKEHPDVIKKFEQLYKEYFAAMAKAKEVEAEMQTLKSEYPALDYFTWKKK
jgi:hypothetical protein